MFKNERKNIMVKEDKIIQRGKENQNQYIIDISVSIYYENKGKQIFYKNQFHKK